MSYGIVEPYETQYDRVLEAAYPQLAGWSGWRKLERLARRARKKMTPKFILKMENKIKKNAKLMQILNVIGCIFLSIIPGIGIVLAAAANAAFQAYMKRREIHDAKKQMQIEDKIRAELQAKYDALPDEQKRVINAYIQKYGDEAFSKPEIKAILDGKFAEVAATLEKDILAAGGLSEQTQAISANAVRNDAVEALQSGENVSPETPVNMEYLKYGALAFGAVALLMVMRK